MTSVKGSFGTPDPRYTASAVFIGSTALLVRCAELFQAAGHTISCVISTDPAVSHWAASRGLSALTPGPADHVLRVLEEQPFDFLFSIANEQVLSPTALRVPRKLALNYHDAPLPRYAGVHATSWAILNGETTHGVTWHEMAARVDAGRIAKQRWVEVAPDETAATLNARCFDAALEAFRDLLADLDAERLTLVEQDLQARTYFASQRRPRAAAFLDWQQSAESLERLVRALTFGPTPNMLGLPKALIAGMTVLVPKLEVLIDEPTPASPGVVMAIDGRGIQVATSTQNALLREVRTVDGGLLSPTDLAELGLRQGQVLVSVDSEGADGLTTAYEVAGTHEAFWIDRLATLEARPLPYVSHATSAEESRRWVTTDWPVSSAAGADADGVLATTAAFLLRLCGGRVLDVGYAEPDLRVPGLDGLFSAYVPLRIADQSGWGVADVLRAVVDELANARRRGPYARDVFVRWPRLARVPTGVGGAALPIALECREDVEGDVRAGPPGCQLRIVVRRDGSAARCLYDTGALAPDCVDRLRQQFGVFVRAAADTQRPLAELPLLTDDERHRLLVEWNATDAELVDGCIDDLVRRQAEQAPEAVAVAWADLRLTYRELQAQADLLAVDLRRRGVAPNTLVGVYLERSPELITAILGILAAGGAYVPLDPGHPPDRLAAVLTDAKVRLVVSHAACRGRLPNDLLLDVLCLEPGAPIGATALAQPAPPIQTSPDDLAYVIYTSGSTGAPKGVAVAHRSLVQSIHARSIVYERPLARFVLLSSVAFDSSVAGLFWTLCSGGTLVLPAQGAERDPAIVADIIVQQRASHLLCLPSLWALVLDHLAGRPPDDLAAVVVAGEPCPPWLVARHAAVLPSTQLFNEYGPTEATVWATVHRCVPQDVEGAVPIGRPIPNTRLYVLDGSGQPVPTGVPGELYIGGAGVAQGYLGKPALTAERFVADPFTTSPNARLYRTGDLVRYRPDSNLDFLGRLDQQVKIRGVRVEPSEVETVLEQHPDVRRAAVVFFDADSPRAGHSMLVAYVEPRPGARVGAAELQDLTRRTLPPEMVPSAFLLLDELPLTPNGKLDRDALPRPESVRLTDRQAAPDYTPPRNGLEWELARLWERGLGIRPVGVHDSFFDLGGDSLVAAELFAQIHRRFGRRLPLAALVRGPTVADVARLLRDDDPSTLPWSPLVPIRDRGAQPPLFCLHSEGGNVLEYRPLARHLGEDRPVYALQARGLDGSEVGVLSIEEMASEYLQSIRLVQPSGPYFLGGYCLGGVLALEAAQQLQADGQEVGLVALIQSATVEYSRPRPGAPAPLHAFRRALARVDRELAGLRLVEPRFRAPYTAARMASLTQAARVRLERLAPALPLPSSRRRRAYSHAYALAALAAAHAAAFERYVPRTYHGPVLLFRASKQPWGVHEDASLGWRDLVDGELELCEVPGFHHYVLREPAVRMIADRLAAALDRAAHQESRGRPVSGSRGR